MGGFTTPTILKPQVKKAAIYPANQCGILVAEHDKIISVCNCHVVDGTVVFAFICIYIHLLFPMAVMDYSW